MDKLNFTIIKVLILFINLVPVGDASNYIIALLYSTIELFIADSSCQSVLHLDYNTVDSHIAAVFENGQIGIYGLTTKVKAMIFNIDK